MLVHLRALKATVIFLWFSVNDLYYVSSNLVQGTVYFAQKYLAVISSGPSRLDFYHVRDGYEYVHSAFLESNGAETQGLAAVGSVMFLGLKGGEMPGNRIKVISVNDQLLDTLYHI